MKHPVSILRNPATRIWLLLMLATGLTWFLVEGHAVSAPIAATSAVLIGGIKARLVFMRYMELQHAPRVWRLLFEAWALVCVSFILLGYWLASS